MNSCAHVEELPQNLRNSCSDVLVQKNYSWIKADLEDEFPSESSQPILTQTRSDLSDALSQAEANVLSPGPAGLPDAYGLLAASVGNLIEETPTLDELPVKLADAMCDYFEGRPSIRLLLKFAESRALYVHFDYRPEVFDSISRPFYYYQFNLLITLSGRLDFRILAEAAAEFEEYAIVYDRLRKDHIKNDPVLMQMIHSLELQTEDLNDSAIETLLAIPGTGNDDWRAYLNRKAETENLPELKAALAEQNQATEE